MKNHCNFNMNVSKNARKLFSKSAFAQFAPNSNLGDFH